MSRHQIDHSCIAGNNCADIGGGGIAGFFTGSVVVFNGIAVAAAVEEDPRGGELPRLALHWHDS